MYHNISNCFAGAAAEPRSTGWEPLIQRPATVVYCIMSFSFHYLKCALRRDVAAVSIHPFTGA